MFFLNLLYKIRGVSPLIIAAILFLAIVEPALPDNPERYFRKSVIPTAGYINATVQKTQSVLEQQENEGNKRPGFFEKSIKNLFKIVSLKLNPFRKTPDNPRLALKKKVSGNNTVSSNQNHVKGLINPYDYHVEIGSGVAEQDGRLISEIIDGIRHVYVGFDNVGFNGQTDPDEDILQSAVDFTSEMGGGIIIVKEGQYRGFRIDNVTAPLLIYGGYDESGHRSFERTSITSGVAVTNTSTHIQLNGFEFAHYYTLPNGITCRSFFGHRTALTLNNVSSFSCLNNTFYGGQGILAENNCNVWISDCDMSTNYYAIEGHGNSLFSIQNNHFTSQSGVMYLNNSHAYITEVSMWGYANAITIDNNSTAILTNNNIAGSFSSCKAYSSDFITFGTNNIDVGCHNADPINTDSTSQHRPLSDKPIEELEVFKPVPDPSDDTYGPNYVPIIDPITTGINPYDIWGSRSSRAYPNTESSSYGNGASDDDGSDSNIGSEEDSFFKPYAKKDEEALLDYTSDSIKTYGFSLPFGNIISDDTRYMEIALMLAALTEKAQEDQKSIIDMIKALFHDTEDLEDEANKKLKEASDKFVEIATIAILEHAPEQTFNLDDLIKMKDIFSDMDGIKKFILAKYKASVNTYYSMIIKELAANMDELGDIKDILYKDTLDPDTLTITRKRIDRLIERLKEKEEKTETENYILKQEEKFRSAFIEPAKKQLDKDIDSMLNTFSGRLDSVLNKKKGPNKKLSDK